MKKGLVLEGGAMRGMFTSGVLDVMMERGILYDGAVGVSAGAAFGCNYKSRQIGRSLRYNMRFCGDKRYCGMRSLLFTGNFYNKDFCYREVPLKHDVFDFEAYKQNPMEFYVVCTDVRTGKPVYHRFEGTEPSGFEWIRASASMPLVSEIVEIDGMLLLDGGISDSVPIRFFEGLGYDRNVVVLTQPATYQKKKSKLFGVMKWKYRKYPEFLKTMEDRHRAYNAVLEYIAKEEEAGRLFVLRPDAPLPIKRVEKKPEKLREVYQIGRRIAEEKMDALLAFLGEVPQGK